MQTLPSSVISCHACPRLRQHCDQIALVKRKSYQDQEYWGKPIPGFGDPKASLLIVGLAPGAHGANRTGRVFTGDSSGDWLYRALHQFNFSNQPHSTHRGDGLRLNGAYVTCVVKCAPPDNHPFSEDLRRCAPFFRRELELVSTAKVYLALGQVAYDRLWQELEKRRKPKFQHGLEIPLENADVSRKTWILASYHPSQQNTFTGKLTQPQFHSVFARARELLENGKSTL